MKNSQWVNNNNNNSNNKNDNEIADVGYVVKEAKQSIK